MSNFSINDAMSKLGIYKSEAEALDAMDGKKDGKISKDIFTQAQEALADAESKYSEDNKGEIITLSKFSKMVQTLGSSVSQRMGFNSFVSSSNTDEDVEETVEYDERHEKIGDITTQALEYFKENKTLEGFKFTGLPKGVKNLRLNIEDYYGNSENDNVRFDKDGNAVVEKVIDGINIEIHYTVDNTDYTVGTAVDFEEANENNKPEGTVEK